MHTHIQKEKQCLISRELSHPQLSQMFPEQATYCEAFLNAFIQPEREFLSISWPESQTGSI